VSWAHFKAARLRHSDKTGFKAEAILAEAKILSVAAVIESMMSHRPYRSGLGIEAALAEIIKGRDRI
jgi:HD-GYP domain-containing protein (c-di-GMP phosphodiesterase class II)